MNNIEIFIIALSLSADTFAVSVASGANIKKAPVVNAFKMAIIFALFQSLMPVIGWLAGNGMEKFVSGFSHWIAFSLLSLIGGKMIWESFDKNKSKEKNPFKLSITIFLAIATSIDALAIGVTFSMLNVAIVYPAIIIGIITFLVALLGIFTGRRMAHFFENRIEFFGGTVLIFIGLKILVENFGLI